jgi:NitT/TauT family transport system permease protein
MFTFFSQLPNRVLGALSFLLLIAIWHGLATYINDNTLPPPAEVLQVFYHEIISGQLLHHLGVTLCRLLASFSIAMLLGCAIGIILGRNSKLDAFFDNWLVIFLNIPALVTIILCYVWFGLIESAAILAVVINKLP